MQSTSEEETLQPVNGNRTKRKRLPANISSHYQTLAGNIVSLREDSTDHKAIGVCGIYANDGVTTVATNLARAITTVIDGNVLLVQANLERSDLARIFRLRGQHGWADVYLEGESPHDVITESRDERLYVMPAGNVPSRSTLTYETSRLRGLVDELKDGFEFVVFDLPLTNELSGCFSLAGVLDGTLMVLQADRATSAAAKGAKSQLERYGANLIGAVVNKKKNYTPSFLRRS